MGFVLGHVLLGGYFVRVLSRTRDGTVLRDTNTIRETGRCQKEKGEEDKGSTSAGSGGHHDCFVA